MVQMLLERDAALEMLRVELDGVRDSRAGTVVFLVGEAGIGKSAVVERFVDGPAGGARVLVGGCDPLLIPRPAGPLRQVAETLGGSFMDLIDAGASSYDLAAQLTEALRRERVTVLVLEDMQWADGVTLDVVRVLTRRLTSVPVLLVLTFRDDELDPRNPLRLVLGELTRVGRVRHLRLAPLSPEAVALLAASERALAQSDVDEIHGVTGGNPFLVAEVLASLRAGPQATGAIPPTVSDVVLGRVAGLDEAATNLLEAVAVLPQRAELWLLDALLSGDGPGPDHRIGDHALGACVASGLLVAGHRTVAFRHELARRVVEGSILPDRRRVLHRRAYAAFASPPAGEPDLLQVVHHADMAGDDDVVLRYAPLAAKYAAAAGSHREAVRLWQRALAGSSSGVELGTAGRVSMLRQLGGCCFLTDQYEIGIDALTAAAALCHQIGDQVGEGNCLAQLTWLLWCPGRIAECEDAALRAVELLERVAVGRDLAHAYLRVAFLRWAGARSAEAVEWANRAIALAEPAGDENLAATALIVAGESTPGDVGIGMIESGLERGRAAGLADVVGWAYAALLRRGLHDGRLDLASRAYGRGIDHCIDHGLELFRLWVLAYGARLALVEDRWNEAVELAESVIEVPHTSTTPRIVSLTVLGLVRARRGETGHEDLLQEAWRLASPTREPLRIAPVAAARHEAAWLAGSVTEIPAIAPTRNGSTRVPRPRGREPRVTYQEALALLVEGDGDGLRASLATFQRLGAKAAAAIAVRRLKERGATTIPRGPRRATRENPAGLTSREVDVLARVARGLHNSEIAAELVLSRRTIDHHLGSILRKLRVDNRNAAVVEGVRLGVVRAPTPSRSDAPRS